MNLPKYKLKEMPKETFVVRVKKTNRYIHIDDYFGLFVKQKMTGCLVLRCIEDAEQIIKTINKIELEVFGELGFKTFTEYESIPFEEAYKTHGIIEKQIVFN
ncbi:MAG: hypothetical protein IPJ01_10960 [Micavibrio sp.]|nr:hypothetical protein [Micavibrio sp.]